MDAKLPMAAGHPSVFGTLSASPTACALGRLDLGFGRSAALWRNRDDRVTYAGAEGHTFSLYLEGGHGTRRLDGPSVEGWPGAVSVMPHDHPSQWEITAPFAFVHLYLPAAELGRAFAETFDRDARLMDLAEVTFADAPAAAGALAGLARAVRAGDPLAAEVAMTEAIAAILSDGRWGGRRIRSVAGGLAPHLVRRLVDHVEAHLGEPLRLADLADLVGLSPFHLQRSFRASRGVSPQVFVAHRRIERAKRLLRGPDPIPAVAYACGFSGQSHLTRAFRAATGVTPARYRTGYRPDARTETPQSTPTAVQSGA